ncbi:hypothetical protein QCE62_22055 [Caballeronia sp. LZ033]|uniref:hypothetical protein n=1 Tax=Caballeronia sp. LZ033 TaxID=3038566 RepID=UPI002857119E|nr:hypothetical protein [Caballeronia sp. LZ033]MDR5816282.1 hypothetical protein [Caballeronia sp. LZ033]
MKIDAKSQLEFFLGKHPEVIFSGFANEIQTFTPQQVWTHVVRIGSQPSVVFSDRCMEDASKSWWKLAQSAELISATTSDVSCLISIGGLGLLPWAMVQFPLETPILEVFAVNRESPEFIVSSKSKDTYLAVVSEEDEIWIYFVNRCGSELKTMLLQP